jgi:hypothetical protein
MKKKKNLSNKLTLSKKTLSILNQPNGNLQGGGKDTQVAGCVVSYYCPTHTNCYTECATC